MDKNIIYQVDENNQLPQLTPIIAKNKKTSFCKSLCSCLFQSKSQHNNEKGSYQTEMDTPKEDALANRKTLVLDLDETLVHSSFQDLGGWDFTIKIEIKGMSFKIFVSVRPGAYAFIEELSKYYNIIIFTASLKEYANPVMNILDPKKKVVGRMFREHCVVVNHQLVKDLSVLKTNLQQVIIVDFLILDNRIAKFHFNFNLKMLSKQKIIQTIERIMNCLDQQVFQYGWIKQFVSCNQFIDVRPVDIFLLKYFRQQQQIIKSSLMELELQDEPTIKCPHLTQYPKKMQSSSQLQISKCGPLITRILRSNWVDKTKEYTYVDNQPVSKQINLSKFDVSKDKKQQKKKQRPKINSPNNAQIIQSSLMYECDEVN